ncbi:MAG: hypothetical protein ACTSPS_06105 [Promethearchaeota archaeon]
MAKKTGEPKSDIPWVEKYRPQSIKEMALPTAKAEGHRVQVAEELIDFVHNFFKEMKKINEDNKKIKAHNRITNEKEHKELLKIDPLKAAILLEGPPGVNLEALWILLLNLSKSSY